VCPLIRRATVGDVWRKMFRRPWLPRIIFVLVIVLACVRLGIWQLDRYEERTNNTDQVAARMAEDPVPLNDVLSPGDELTADGEWAQVTVTGCYDAGHQLAQRLRPIEGTRGLHDVVPLVTDGGAALLVDRGLLPDADTGDELPAPPEQEVSVTARLRVSQQGEGTGADSESNTIRYVDVEEIGTTLPYELYGGWAELVEESPDGTDELMAVPPPELDSGPHLSYAVQWFLFACVGVGGFIVLMRTESPKSRS